MTLSLVLLGAWLEVGPGSYGVPRPPPQVVRPAPVVPPRPAVIRSYQPALDRLEERRLTLGARYRAATTGAEREEILADARETVFDAITGDIIPAWIGTRWSYHGTSETPGSGSIACGYFVATVLRDAGFSLDRVPLAQQGSANIVRTLVPERWIVDTEESTPSDVIAGARGEAAAGHGGLFAIGFDGHVGLLVVRGASTQLCHSSNRTPKSVRCEPAATARSMISKRHVIGPLLTDESVLGWLDARHLSVVTE